MQREQAVNVIKEIFAICHHVEGKSIKLMPPNADDVLSKGCQIHLQTRNDRELDSCIKAIADSEGLAVAKEGDNLIIYKPMQAKT